MSESVTYFFSMIEGRKLAFASENVFHFPLKIIIDLKELWKTLPVLPDFSTQIYQYSGFSSFPLWLSVLKYQQISIHLINITNLINIANIHSCL